MRESEIEKVRERYTYSERVRESERDSERE